MVRNGLWLIVLTGLMPAAGVAQDAAPAAPTAFRNDLRVLPDHPRLLFTRAQIPELKARCEGAHKADYEKMKAWADAHLDGNVANGGPTFGLLYHLTGEEKYAQAGKVVLKRCFDGRYSSDDRLFQFEKCIMFDLLYPALSTEEREEYNKGLFDAMSTYWEKAKHRVWQFHSVYNFGQLVLALNGNGYKDAEVAAIFDALAEQTETKYWPDMEEAARNRGGIKDGLFCRCTESFVVPYFMMWQNATGQKVFETKNVLRNYGTYYIYNLVNVHERDTDIKNANTAPLGSIYHGSLGRPGSQGLPIVAAMAGDGISAWIADQKWWQAARGMNYWSDNPPPQEIYFRIIFRDPKLKHVEPKELPETALFEKWGWVAMRNSWDADGVFAQFKCGDYRCGEPAHLDNNQFIIYHKGFLAHDGLPDQKPDGSYGQMSLAHNTVTVYDPDEAIMGSEKYTWWLPRKRFEVNDGGQTFQKARMVTPSFGWVLTPSQDLGDITQYETAPRFDYACGDATKAYNPKKVELFTRQFVFLKPDTFVVFDRVVSAKPEFRKRWHLHSLEEPAIRGDLVSVTRKGGRLWVQTLLPAQPVIRKVQGAQVEKPDGTYEVPEYWKQCPTDVWRVDIGPKEARQADVFLHVLQAVDAGKDMTAKAEASEKDGRVSVKVSVGKAEWEMTFATSGGPAGHIRLVEDGPSPAEAGAAVRKGGKAVIDRNFAGEVVDSYWQWKDDPRFRMWMTDPRFRYTIPGADVERYGKEPK